MFILQLNPVTGKAESVRAVACGETREELEQLLVRSLVEPYQEGRLRLTFRAGSPLQYFNPPGWDGSVTWGTPAIVDVGTEDTWAEKARESFRNQIMSLPRAEQL